MTNPDLAARLAARGGLIPVSVDSDPDRIVWMDLEQFHCYQGFFNDAINVWTSMRGAELYCCTSALGALKSIPIPANSLPPTAFIFHAGRCGSTLLAQVLSRSRQNMVFSEAAPHNQIWWKNPQVFRNLVLAMGRRRLSSYRAHIVKFTSFNILRFDQIRAAFPGVPSLFLFREPGAMLASYDRGKPVWMGRALPDAAVEAFFRAALSIRDPDFRCLDYSLLTPESMGSIASFFHVDASPLEWRLMMEGFRWDAKSGVHPRRFSAPDNHKRAVSAVLKDLYAQLTVWKSLKSARS